MFRPKGNIILDEIGSEEFLDQLKRHVRLKGSLMRVLKERELEMKKMQGEVVEAKKMNAIAKIVEKKGKYFLESKDGKNIGKKEGYETKKDAAKRLKEIEYFKNKKASLQEKLVREVDGKHAALARMASEIEISAGYAYNGIEREYISETAKTFSALAKRLYGKIQKENWVTAAGTAMNGSKKENLEKIRAAVDVAQEMLPYLPSELKKIALNAIEKGVEINSIMEAAYV